MAAGKEQIWREHQDASCKLAVHLVGGKYGGTMGLYRRSRVHHPSNVRLTLHFIDVR
jgi:hypothetical protein